MSNASANANVLTPPLYEASVTRPSAPRPERRLRWRVIAPLGAAILFMVAAIAASGNGSGKLIDPRTVLPEPRMERLLALIPQSGPVLGSPRAPVTVTQFVDLQCADCEAYTLTLLPRILSRYVRTGEVKLVFRCLGFVGTESIAAGRAAEAAAFQNKLWNFAYAFYYRQQAQNSGYVTPAFLRRVGSAVPGLDVAEMMAASRTPGVLTGLRANTAEAMADAVRAAPTFIVQGTRGRPYELQGPNGLWQAIGQALAG